MPFVARIVNEQGYEHYVVVWKIKKNSFVIGDPGRPRNNTISYLFGSRNTLREKDKVLRENIRKDNRESKEMLEVRKVMQDEQVILTKEDPDFYTKLQNLSTYEKSIMIYCNNESSDNFIVAYIVLLFEEMLLLEMISPYGFNDGFISLRIDEIQKIVVFDEYIQKMNKLWIINHQVHRTINKHGKVFSTILTNAFETKHIVSIQSKGSDVYDTVGFINQVEDDYCLVQRVNEYGFLDNSKKIIYFNTISTIQYYSIEEITIEKLFYYNYNVDS